MVKENEPEPGCVGGGATKYCEEIRFFSWYLVVRAGNFRQKLPLLLC